MRTFKSWLMAGCLVLVTAQLCSAAGFAIYEWSARDFALGGATVGRADDPAALATNPAGITQLDGIQVMAGVMPIKPLMTIETPGKSTDSDDSSVFFLRISTPPGRSTTATASVWPLSPALAWAPSSMMIGPDATTPTKPPFSQCPSTPTWL